LRGVPNTLQTAIDEALQAMRTHPQHHLAPYYRQKIYTLLKTFNKQNESKVPRTPSPDNPGDRARSWLAVQTAERVMPIFEQGTFGLDDVPDGSLELPPMLLDAARGIMLGAPAPDVLIQSMGLAFDQYSLMLEHSKYEPENLPVNAVLAGSATERTLSEVLGWYRFDLMNEGYKKRWLRPPSEEAHHPAFGAGYEARNEGEELEEPPEIRAGQLNDEALVRSGGDAAGEAAVAYACGPLSTRCEPERLEEFWTWWLTEALPGAWEKASREAATR
jgi:hypothetical protein